MVETPSCSLEVTMSTTSAGSEREDEESVLQCKESKVCVIHSYSLKPLVSVEMPKSSSSVFALFTFFLVVGTRRVLLQRRLALSVESKRD